MSWFRRQIQREEPPPARKRSGLSSHQRRALNSTLTHLERNLLNLEHLLVADEQGILIRRTGQPSPATRQRLLALFGQLRQEISALATEQSLPGIEEDVGATLAGTAAVLWCDLEDIRPRKLSRYGEVDPALEETIGPHIEKLIQGILSIEAIVNSAEERPS